MRFHRPVTAIMGTWGAASSRFIATDILRVRKGRITDPGLWTHSPVSPADRLPCPRHTRCKAHPGNFCPTNTLQNPLPDAAEFMVSGPA